jgi:hypothetical protein
MTAQGRRAGPLTRRQVFLLLLAAGLLAGCGPSAGAQSPRLRAVDGGPDYYARFEHGLPSDPSFFPIGVWFESVVDEAGISKDHDAGINTYVVLTADSDLRLIASYGMKAILQASEWASRAAAVASEAVAGWMLFDEIDMQQGPRTGYQTLLDIRAKLPRDGRLRYNNYGKGVLFWETNAEAARFVNEFQDIVSADAYWFTDNDIRTQYQGGALFARSARSLTDAESRRAANYGATVRRIRELVRPAGSKPVWHFVEVGHPFTEADWPSIKPEEISAAVWSGIINGARGVVYFNHSFGGPVITQHALRETAYSKIRAQVKRTNAQIMALAPVLNAPFVDGLVDTDSAVDVMAKLYQGRIYLFTGSRAAASRQVRFDLPCVGNATVTVLDENRSIPLVNGAFSDAFADGNAVHIYRIDGGSTCGLSQ